MHRAVEEAEAAAAAAAEAEAAKRKADLHSVATSADGSTAVTAPPPSAEEDAADAQLMATLAATMSEPCVALSATAASSKHARLLELLPGSSLLFVNAMCVGGGRDAEPAMLRATLQALDAYEMLGDALVAGISNEVDKTDSASTLFRSNT